MHICNASSTYDQGNSHIKKYVEQLPIKSTPFILEGIEAIFFSEDFDKYKLQNKCHSESNIESLG